jgi:glutathione peroxidase
MVMVETNFFEQVIPVACRFIHMPEQTFYNFSARSIEGEDIAMDAYRGKVVLIVNTASACGYTPQYAGLEELYQKYRDDGLVVLGFPCNQFGGQEPGSEEEIMAGCLTDYAVSFPMFSKVEVNGNDAHPIFKFLKKSLPGFLGGRIKWNFTKFLLDREGDPVKRFGTQTTPAKIGEYLKDRVFSGD